MVELLQVDELVKYFPIHAGLLNRTIGHVHAVDGVSFAVNRGEAFGLVGESGCGKTTLAQTVVRLYDPTKGRILFDGTDIASLGAAELQRYRRRIQMIFQDPYASLDPRMTVGAIVGEPLEIFGTGTTGKQKGATLSHGNLVSNTHATVHTEGITPEDRLLLFLPLFHVFGQNAILNSALAGAASVVLQRRYDPVETLNVIEREGVTMFFGVPTIYIGMLNAAVSPSRLASVRYYFSAAATMPVEIAERWKARYGRPIVEGYGLTETSPFATYNHVWHHRPGSVGTPIENVEITILDPEDRPLEAGAWGEICIKGPNVMLGYWNRPDDTAQAIRNGWFHSGDIGYMDEDGYIFIVDRVKDMINSAGFKIWPREVEEVLFRHPAIRECAVIGLADSEKGEIPAVYLVLRDGASLSVGEFDAYCRQHLAAYKVPRRVEFVEALPKNATGKILKRLLRDTAN